MSKQHPRGHQQEDYWRSLAPHKAELLARLPGFVKVHGCSILDARPIQYWLPFPEEKSLPENLPRWRSSTTKSPE